MNRGLTALFGSLARTRPLLAAVLTVASFAALAPIFGAGCSSGSGSAGPSCDSSRCAAGNQCIDDGSGSGPSCHEVCTAETCPTGYYCNDGQLSGQPANWCVQSTTYVSPDAGSPWGVPCLPSGGESNNPACDREDGFSCYGVSPTDADAFCTVFGCQSDAECPGGWWCETVNTAPNVKTATRSFGKTRSVCTPRQYCATCLMDHDCPAATDGTQQHCIGVGAATGDAGATPGYCAPQCSSNANCALDAKCATQWKVCSPAQGQSCQSDDDCPPSNDFYQHCDAGTCTQECGSASDCTGNGQACTALATCEPRAGTCLGTGGFCSPCRSDADCTGGGSCLYADYSTERYCSAPVASGTCPTSTMTGVIINEPNAGQCPKAPAGSGAADPTKGAVGCTFSSTSTAPTNQCVALVSISDGNGGEASVLGCWTVNR